MGGGGSGQVGQESLAEGSILPQGGRTKEVRADLYLNISDAASPSQRGGGVWGMGRAERKRGMRVVQEWTDDGHDRLRGRARETVPRTKRGPAVRGCWKGRVTRWREDVGFSDLRCWAQVWSKHVGGQEECGRDERPGCGSGGLPHLTLRGFACPA